MSICLVGIIFSLGSYIFLNNLVSYSPPGIKCILISDTWISNRGLIYSLYMSRVFEEKPKLIF